MFILSFFWDLYHLLLSHKYNNALAAVGPQHDTSGDILPPKSCRFFRRQYVCESVWGDKVRLHLPHNMSGFPLALLGVVHTPVKSNALPSIVFILRKMSALLQVERAGDSMSVFSSLRESFLCEWKRRGGPVC